MQFIFLLIFSLFLYPVWGQTKSNTRHDLSLHLVSFKDKKQSPYSILRPQDFLSPRAIERREIQGVSIDELDLPISPSYIKAITNLGVNLQNKTRWLNGIIIHTDAIPILDSIRKMPFVQSVKTIGEFRKIKPGKFYTKRPPVDSSTHTKGYYGHAKKQIEMLGGIGLHQLGFNGKDVHVAIADGGFMNAYRVAMFDSLYIENRILGTHDFVDGDDYIYQHSTHGTNVLSTMAANIPGLMVGTAPKASYYLFKTEDTRNEYPAEEYNWLAAMEYADSLGVDVVNSSLGYSIFRNEAMSYSYKDVNGKTSIISRGAEIATAKGMLLVNAAGNEGARDWHYIFSPADVEDVLVVAAVDESGKRAPFSSWGPTADGRLKPDVAALGSNTTLTSIITYGVSHGEGTSYACPILCGMVASLKEALPSTPNKEIRQAIKESGHQANNPDTSLGYGIPDFTEAYIQLSEASILVRPNKIINNQKIIRNELAVYLEYPEKKEVELNILTASQKKCYQKVVKLEANKIHKEILPTDKLKAGVYLLETKIGKQKRYALLAKGN